MRLLEVKQPNIIVVYGGGFQPFHEGHASSYREAKAAFPGAHFFVAASNVTTERPFEFKEKQFLAQQAGVVDPFIQVGTMSYVNDNGRKVTSTPLNPLEVLQKFNPERDVLVIVRSERDPMKTTDVSYYQPWAGIQGAEPFSKHAYIFVTKKHDFSIAGNPVYSGSQVRELYSGADDKTKLTILQDLYPQSRQLDKIKKIFDKRLSLTESTDIQIPTEDGITWQDIRLMAGEGKLTKKTVLQAIAVIRKQRRSQGVTEDVNRAEAQADYMEGQCMVLAVAINQYNPQRYPIGYIWEYNMSAGAPDMQLDDDEWNDLSPEEQEEISNDISRHSVVHAYVRDHETNEYIDARGRHKTLPNLWGRMGQTRFEEFPGTARELIDITAHGDWDEVGDQVNFKRGQPAFDSLAGPAGVKRALDYAIKYLGVVGPESGKPPGVEYNLEEEAANLLEYLRKIHKRWAIVSKKGGRPLVYFKGDGKPSKDWVEKQERRINYFKHKK